MAVLLHDRFNDGGDLVGVVQVDQIGVIRIGDLFDILSEFVAGTIRTIQHHRNGAFFGQSQRYALADAFEASGDDDHLVLKMQVHLRSSRPVSPCAGTSCIRRASSPCRCPERAVRRIVRS